MIKLNKITTLALSATLLVLPACDAAKNQLAADRSGNLEIQDYKDALAPRMPEIEESKKANDYASIPSLQPYVAGVSGNVNAMPLVSVSVNQTVPLRDVLYEIAQQADYDIELDPRITGAIIFTAREKPLDEVIDRISDIAGLRYKFEGETLRVELDTPFNKAYKIDYINLVRTNSSSISNDIGVVSGDGSDTGSSFNSDTESVSDFWADLEASVQQILAAAETNILRTAADPQITATAQNPDVAPVAANVGGNVQVSAPDVNLNIGSLPTGETESFTNPELSYNINRQASLLQIYAPQRVQKKVEEYLKVLKKAVTSQVLIEAKILEVSLSDEYETGIDWSGLNFLSNELTFDFGGTSNVATGAGFSANFLGNDFNTLLRAVSRFGTVNALASPRMTVLNNQSAVLNVATNRVFFEIDIESTSTDGGGSEVDIDSEIRNVPVGVLVNVQPSIDTDTGTVTMALRPTVTNLSGDGIEDPGVSFAIAQAAAIDEDFAGTGIRSIIPELNVQEIDSIVKVRSGQAVVLGGLLQDRVVVSDEGVPIASEVPILGNLFKEHENDITKTELVIFIKATILENPEDSVHDTDRDLYRQFSNDRRPLRL